MDEYLKATIRDVDWERARLTFGQRVNLLKWDVLVRDKNFDPIPAIKHLSKLRNKISHRLEIKLDTGALQPLAEYMWGFDSRSREMPSDPKQLLDAFVSTCCATFASHLDFHPRAEQLGLSLLYTSLRIRSIFHQAKSLK